MIILHMANIVSVCPDGPLFSQAEGDEYDSMKELEDMEVNLDPQQLHFSKTNAPKHSPHNKHH